MSKRKLLLADDSVTIQKVVNLTFADEGIEVHTVGDGAAAIEQLAEIAPDLVLADVHMPGLTGYEVCEQIRQTPSYQNIPVMLLVGSFEPFDEVEARRVGANDYLTKPFQSIPQLVQRVTALLEAQTENSASSLSKDLSARETNLGDDDMIETIPGSNFELDNAVSSLTEPSFVNSSAMSNENESNTAGERRENFEMRPTAPLSYADIQEIGSVSASSSSSDSFTNETATSTAATDFRPESSWEAIQTDSFSTTDSSTSDVFELELDSPEYEQTPEIQISLPPDQPFETHISEIKEIEATSAEPREAESSFELLETPEIETVYATNSYYASEASGANANLEYTAPIADDFSESSILELDNADLLSSRDQDEDSILDLQIEPSNLSSQFTNDFEVNDQPVALEALETNEATSLLQTVESEPPTMSAMPLNQHFNAPLANTAIQADSPSTIGNLSSQYPPEVIDAIAQKVVEKLSDKVIERIAWEVVPDRFDSIMRQYIESRKQ